MKGLSSRQKAERAYPFLREAHLFPEKMTDAHWGWLEKVVESLTERVDCFSDLAAEALVLFEFSASKIEDEAKEELRTECAQKVIKLFGEKISQLKSFDYDQFASMTEEIAEETGCRSKALYHPLRIALTTRTSGLKLDKFITLVEEGARLSFPAPLKNCSQRVSEILDFMKSSRLSKREERRS
jgi:nondiscriminating glutamyl-tRNA synthetase